MATHEEAAQPLWRGVRGELPRSFWAAGETAVIAAVDMAFMSTSRHERTPIEYMGGGANVLWELRPQTESDSAYHRGADISMLSQFEGEREVLFPPCTMLEVKRAPGSAAEAPRTESAPTCVLAVFCVLCFVCFGALGRSLCFVFCVLAFARGTLLSRKRYALCFRFEGAPQAPILGGKMDSTY